MMGCIMGKGSEQVSGDGAFFAQIRCVCVCVCVCVCSVSVCSYMAVCMCACISAYVRMAVFGGSPCIIPVFR